MSYSSENTIPPSVAKKDLVKVIELLGYRQVVTWVTKDGRVFDEYEWFNAEGYRSWTGITLTVSQFKTFYRVSTTTNIGRSYYDLEHQNDTARTLKRLFGGSLRTDEGKNRFLQPRYGPPTPSQSGCYLAFERFGLNLRKAAIFFEYRHFAMQRPTEMGVLSVLDEMNPWLLSNNLLVPYLVSTIEEFFRSTFVALLTHSPRKESFFRSARLGAALISVSTKAVSVEEALAQSLSFQSILSLCRHFRELDPRIDFAAALKKPYRRRKVNLFSSFEDLISRRHSIIHQSAIDGRLTDGFMDSILQDIEVGVSRCYRLLTELYHWPFIKDWQISPKKRREAQPAKKKAIARVRLRRGRAPRVTVLL